MKRISRKIADLPLHDRALIALRAAVRKAIARRHEMGLPAYVWRDGHIEELAPAHTAGKRSNRLTQGAPAKARPRKRKP